MVISILHRVTGSGMALLGALGLLWWLAAAASGPASYATFLYYVWEAGPGDLPGFIANMLSRLVLIGLSWAFFQHMLSGLRHFVLDMGAGYELKTNRFWSSAIMLLSVLMTAALWIWMLGGLR